MQVRLAFAVAAHLEPEILIIDEVLAVGDAEFQKRCLGKMNEVSRSGRTVLFVSHNMAAVEGLCSHALLLHSGRKVLEDNPEYVIRQYLTTRSGELSGEQSFSSVCPLLRSLRIIDANGVDANVFGMGDTFGVEFAFRHLQKRTTVNISLRVYNSVGQRLLTCNNAYQEATPCLLHGAAVVRCLIRDVRLLPGIYTIKAVVSAGATQFPEFRIADVEVIARDIYRTGRLPSSQSGVWAPDVSWYYMTSAALNNDLEAPRTPFIS
jgi:lipopolysaccharide transport system ATP-binding protein